MCMSSVFKKKQGDDIVFFFVLKVPNYLYKYPLKHELKSAVFCFTGVT